MATTDRDIAWFIYGIRRLREETLGCAQWDEGGVAKYAAEFKNWNFAIAVEQMLRVGTDPEARTPATIPKKLTRSLPSEKSTAPVNPKPREACPDCGDYAHQGPCRGDEPPPPPVVGDPVAVARAAARAAKRGLTP